MRLLLRGDPQHQVSGIPARVHPPVRLHNLGEVVGGIDDDVEVAAVGNADGARVCADPHLVRLRCADGDLLERDDVGQPKSRVGGGGHRGGAVNRGHRTMVGAQGAHRVTKKCPSLPGLVWVNQSAEASLALRGFFHETKQLRDWKAKSLCDAQ